MKRSYSKSDAKELILAMFDKTVRPVLVGHAALELKWPLAWVEPLFDELVDEQKIRLCTPGEMYAHDIIHGFFKIAK